MSQTVSARSHKPFLSKRMRENLKGYLFILSWLI